MKKIFIVKQMLKNLKRKKKKYQKIEIGEQKKMFLTMLDLNQMYICASEVEDTGYGISGNDIKLTKEFYGDSE